MAYEVTKFGKSLEKFRDHSLKMSHFLFCFTILAALAALKLSLAQFWADYADSKHFNFGCHSHYERLRDFDTKMFQLFYTRNGAEKVNKITKKLYECLAKFSDLGGCYI